MEDIDGADVDDQIAQQEFEELMGMSVKQILEEGQKALFARLVSKVRTGTSSHQEAAILRNILKDNGLTLGIPPEGFGVPNETQDVKPLDIPEFGEPEYRH